MTGTSGNGSFFYFLLNLFQRGVSDPRMQLEPSFFEPDCTGCESANHEIDQRELHINRIFINLAIIKLKLTQPLPYSEPNHVYKLFEKGEICLFKAPFIM
jgi:hypothetical protein